MADGWSKTWTFLDGDWHEGNVPIMGPRTHAAWLGSSVFDGARAFEGVAPDIDLHCARVNDSASKMLLKPIVSQETWLGLVADGRKRFDARAALYIRPMYWAEHGGPFAVPPDPESTRWCLSLYEASMPQPAGLSITLSPFRRPTLETMPVDAKALRRQVRGALHGLDRMRASEAYWYVGRVVGEVRDILEQAWAFVRAGDGRTALAMLEAGGSTSAAAGATLVPARAPPGRRRINGTRTDSRYTKMPCSSSPWSPSPSPWSEVTAIRARS